MLISDFSFYFSYSQWQIDRKVYETETYAVEEDLERP